MKYATVIEKAEGNYSAYAPDLPSCVTVGDTLEEVEEAMREAMEFHIDGMQEEGLPIPEPKSISKMLELSRLSWQ